MSKLRKCAAEGTTFDVTLSAKEAKPKINRRSYKLHDKSPKETCDKKVGTHQPAAHKCFLQGIPRKSLVMLTRLRMRCNMGLLRRLLCYCGELPSLHHMVMTPLPLSGIHTAQKLVWWLPTALCDDWNGEEMGKKWSKRPLSQSATGSCCLCKKHKNHGCLNLRCFQVKIIDWG